MNEGSLFIPGRVVLLVPDGEVGPGFRAVEEEVAAEARGRRRLAPRVGTMCLSNGVVLGVMLYLDSLLGARKGEVGRCAYGE